MRTPLSPTQAAQLQAQLEAARAALDAQRLEHLGGVSRAEHARQVLLQDGDDATQRDADREVALATADREVVALADIDAALARLQHGSYGLCASCDAPIPWARLQLQPTATRCVACAGRLERGAPRTASI